MATIVTRTDKGSALTYAEMDANFNNLNGALGTTNATDAALRDRSTHTGTQAASTITGFVGGGTGTQYVSKDGNDANDGLSWQKSKLTVAAAVAGLPTKTSGSESFKAGTIHLGPGVFVEQGNLPIQRAIRVVGAAAAEDAPSVIQLAANRNVHLINYEAAWATAGGYCHGLIFENVLLDGNYLNQGATTLSASLTNNATSLTVAAFSAFPTTGTFDILIDDEILVVTAGAGSTAWTVTRGKYGSVAAAHASAAAVRWAGSALVMRGGGFNSSLNNFFVKNCGGPGVRLDENAVNFLAFDFNASTCGGPALAYIGGPGSSGSMMSMYNCQIDDCGTDAIYIEGNQSGSFVAHFSAVKFESRVSSTKHNHCIAYKPNRGTNDASGATIVVNGCVAFGLSGGREAVCYNYAGTNQAAAWEISGGGSKDGYVSGFKDAKNGWQSAQAVVGRLSAGNSDTAQGANAGIEVGRLQIAEAGWNPEGGFTAQRGSLFAHGNASDYAVLKTKATGTGNTGWTTVAVINPVFSQTDGATITWAAGGSALPNAKVTLGGNRTLAITGVANGQRGTLIVTQDATGGRTLALPSGSKTSGAPTTSASAINKYEYLYDGTSYFWSISPGLV